MIITPREEKMDIKLKILLLSILTCHIIFDTATAEIRLGVAGPFSGVYEPYGTPMLNAATLVVSDINANGGINGETVIIISQDDQCSTSMATTAANNLVSAGVDVVLGHICSNATLAGIAVYDIANIPAMSPASSNRDLTYSGSYPLFFRTILPDHLQAETMIHYSIYELKVGKFGLVHDGSTYGSGLISFVDEAIAQEANKTVIFTRDIGSVGVQSIVNEAISTGVEVIIYGGGDSNAATLLNELRTQTSEIHFMAGEGVLTDTFLSGTSTNSNGALIANFGETTEKYLEQKAREDHIDEYGEEPGPYFMSAYAAAYSLLMAIENAGSTDPAQIKNELISEDYVTPIGEISFDDRGDVENVNYSLYEIENGETQEAYDGTFTPFQVKGIILYETRRWDYNQNQVVDMTDVLNGLRVSSGYTD